VASDDREEDLRHGAQRSLPEPVVERVAVEQARLEEAVLQRLEGRDHRHGLLPRSIPNHPERWPPHP
jgi:hypothetical protein